ncbi:phasin family protein [Roseovarius sp. SYSU LYC5161]|uniref:phasin family protein n=1 Tax=Roseovarius halophilus (ex Wu et al. 2025) TaxID=3376060 RepID=UPI00399B473A
MTKKKDTSKAQGTDDPMGQMQAMMAQWQTMGLGGMNAMGTGWMEAMSEMGREWLQFVSERVARDVAFQQQMLQAKSPQDVQKIQSEFLQAAVEDYTKETGKMVELSRKVFAPDEDSGSGEEPKTG